MKKFFAICGLIVFVPIICWSRDAEKILLRELLYLKCYSCLEPLSNPPCASLDSDTSDCPGCKKWREIYLGASAYGKTMSYTILQSQPSIDNKSDAKNNLSLGSKTEILEFSNIDTNTSAAEGGSTTFESVGESASGPAPAPVSCQKTIVVDISNDSLDNPDKYGLTVLQQDEFKKGSILVGPDGIFGLVVKEHILFPFIKSKQKFLLVIAEPGAKAKPTKKVIILDKSYDPNQYRFISTIWTNTNIKNNDDCR